MLISTRGRYALRVMIDLAEQGGTGFIPLKDISKRQHISQKYLESIMTTLSKNGFIEAVHGKGGGYRLNRPLEEYKVGDLLLLTEGTLAPVACLQCGAQPCEKADTCRTLPMWTNLHNMITSYLGSVSLADFIKSEDAAELTNE